MCDRIGCTHFPKLTGHGFFRPRGFFAPQLPEEGRGRHDDQHGRGRRHDGPAHAAGGIKSTHGSGFCNLNYFLPIRAADRQGRRCELDFVNTPTFAEQVTFLGIGQVDAGLIPYTSFIALFDAGAPVKIVAGGGIQGCVLVAQPGLDSPRNSRARRSARSRWIRWRCCRTTG